MTHGNSNAVLALCSVTTVLRGHIVMFSKKDEIRCFPKVLVNSGKMGTQDYASMSIRENDDASGCESFVGLNYKGIIKEMGTEQ